MADPSKTEKPTPRKRKKSRSDGQVAKSVEVSTVAVFIAALYILKINGISIVNKLRWLIVFMFENAHTMQIVPVNLNYYTLNVILFVLWVIWPVVITVVLLVIILNVVQVGFHVAWKSIAPKFSKLNPITGIKSKFFSMTVLVDLVKSLGKISISAYIVYGYLRDRFDYLIALQYADLVYGFVVVAKMLYEILFRLILFFIVLAAFDYIYQKWKFEQDLKMTKEEVKEERKRQEGSPEVKRAIRKKQMQMSRSRMIAKVPEADVVVTNPIHLAVALKYDSVHMTAPIVVAKGARYVAETIKEVAKKHQIPIVENVQLAQTLYKLVEVDQEIPHHLFNVVAEVLSYVHRLTGKMYGLNQSK